MHNLQDLATMPTAGVLYVPAAFLLPTSISNRTEGVAALISSQDVLAF